MRGIFVPINTKFQVITMDNILTQLLPHLRDIAWAQARFPTDYIAQCRRVAAAEKKLRESLNKEQWRLYLALEAEMNRQLAMEENCLMEQSLRLARGLWR